jgi:hypothetical protein
MLPPDQWDEVINRLTGTLYRGTERISSAAILNALGVPPCEHLTGLPRGEILNDPALKVRTRIGKLVASRMRNMGWTGPKVMRLDANRSGQGYWRIPSAFPRVAPEVADDLRDTDADALPEQLETVCRLGLREIRRILRLPLDEGNAGLLRAKVTAGVAAINAQLRADESRMRTRATSDVLDRLEKLIREQRKLLPQRDAGSTFAGEVDAAVAEPIKQSVEPNSA